MPVFFKTRKENFLRLVLKKNIKFSWFGVRFKKFLSTLKYKRHTIYWNSLARLSKFNISRSTFSNIYSARLKHNFEVWTLATRAVFTIRWMKFNLTAKFFVIIFWTQLTEKFVTNNEDAVTSNRCRRSLNMVITRLIIRPAPHPSAPIKLLLAEFGDPSGE